MMSKSAKENTSTENKFYYKEVKDSAVVSHVMSFD